MNTGIHHKADYSIQNTQRGPEVSGKLFEQSNIMVLTFEFTRADDGACVRARVQRTWCERAMMRACALDRDPPPHMQHACFAHTPSTAYFTSDASHAAVFPYSLKFVYPPHVWPSESFHPGVSVHSPTAAVRKRDSGKLIEQSNITFLVTMVC